MSNPIYQALGGQQPLGNVGQMMQQFKQFASNFKGNPRAQVQALLNSGRMSQAQFNQLQQMATQLQQQLKDFRL